MRSTNMNRLPFVIALARDVNFWVAAGLACVFPLAAALGEMGLDPAGIVYIGLTLWGAFRLLRIVGEHREAAASDKD